MALAAPRRFECVDVLDVHVHNVSMQEALQRIQGFIAERGPHHVVTLDASMCVLAGRDLELRRIIQQAHLITPDSAGVLWACRRSGHPLQERVSGVDLVERLCALSSKAGIRLFFLGAAPGVAEQAAETMRARYPGCQIVGTQDGYYRRDQEPAVLQAIQDAAPHVLCVALGIPKQEKWIDTRRSALDVPVMIGVGGTFDVLSGRVPRAPRWMQRAGLEWLHRLIRNPRKLAKVRTLPVFVWRVLRSPAPREAAPRE